MGSKASYLSAGDAGPEPGPDLSNEWEMSGRGRSLGEPGSLDQAYIMITTSHYDTFRAPIWGHSSQHGLSNVLT